MRLSKFNLFLLGIVMISQIGLQNTLFAQEETKEKTEDSLKIGGALRYNLRYTDYGAEAPRKLTFGFDTFRLDVKAVTNGWILDAQYRFYGYGGSYSGDYQTIHHGWIGRKTGKNGQVELGITQVPFGNLTYASHNWYFVTPYYVGLEDDYDAGIKFSNKTGKLSYAVAYFMTAEPGVNSFGSRYSYDVNSNSLSDTDGNSIAYTDENSNGTYDAGEAVGLSLEERNQFNLRFAYDLEGTEIGISGQYGQIYNSFIKEYGDSFAAAIHVNGNYGPVNVKAQYLYYKYDVKNDLGETSKVVNMTAYLFPYDIAAEAQMFTIGASYTLKIGGIIDSLIFYDDYTYTLKAESNFNDTQQNTIGFVIAAGGIWTYVDFSTAKNQPWIGDPYYDGLATGTDNKWRSNLNINIAYYF